MGSPSWLEADHAVRAEVPVYIGGAATPAAADFQDRRTTHRNAGQHVVVKLNVKAVGLVLGPQGEWLLPKSSGIEAVVHEMPTAVRTELARQQLVDGPVEAFGSPSNRHICTRRRATAEAECARP